MNPTKKRRAVAVEATMRHHWQTLWEAFWNDVFRPLSVECLDAHEAFFARTYDERKRAEEALNLSAFGVEDAEWDPWVTAYDAYVPEDPEAVDLARWPYRIPEPPPEPDGLWAHVELRAHTGTLEGEGAAAVLLLLSSARAVRRAREAAGSYEDLIHKLNAQCSPKKNARA
jgi:hypothetical protein